MAAVAATPIAFEPFIRPLSPEPGFPSLRSTPVQVAFSIPLPPIQSGAPKRTFTLLNPAHMVKERMAIYFGKVAYVDAFGNTKEVEAAFKICKFPFSKEKSSKTEHSLSRDFNFWCKKLAVKECEILQRLEKARNIVRCLGSFWISDTEFCTAMDRLPATLTECLELRVKYTLAQVQLFARGLMHTLQDMKEAHIVHADIKPDNLCPKGKELILFDFEGGLYKDGGLTVMRTTLNYRSPEFVLGETPNYSFDMWSAGVTLFEMYTSQRLFLTPEKGLSKELQEKLQNLPKEQKQLELVRAMIKLIGPPPQYFYDLDKGQMYFEKRDKKFKLTAKSFSENLYCHLTWYDLEKIVCNTAEARKDSKEAAANFITLLKQIIVWEPRARPTPEIALASEFLAKPLNDLSEEKKAKG